MTLVSLTVILKEAMLERLLKIMCVIIIENFECTYIYYVHIIIQKEKIESLDVYRVTNALMACQDYMKMKDVRELIYAIVVNLNCTCRMNVVLSA